MGWEGSQHSRRVPQVSVSELARGQGLGGVDPRGAKELTEKLPGKGSWALRGARSVDSDPMEPSPHCASSAKRRQPLGINNPIWSPLHTASGQDHSESS